MNKCIMKVCGQIAGSLLLGEVVRLTAKIIYRKGERDVIRHMRDLDFGIAEIDGQKFKVIRF